MSTASALSPATHSAARAWFEDHLPELTSRCRRFVRYLPRPEREDAAAEALAQAFRYTLSAEARGKLQLLTPHTLVAFFGRSYRAGRRMAGSNCTDVLSEASQRRHHLRVVSLDQDGTPRVTERPVVIRLSEALADPKGDHPLENVRRNIDYPEILERAGANRKVKRVFTFLCQTAGVGRQVELARELGVSAPRVSQLKSQLAEILATHGYQPPVARSSDDKPRKRGRPTGHRLDRIPLNAANSPTRRRRDRPRDRCVPRLRPVRRVPAVRRDGVQKRQA